jgi:hypothetical protein
MAVDSARAIPRMKIGISFPEASGWREMAWVVPEVAMPMPMPAPRPVRTATPAPIRCIKSIKLSLKKIIKIAIKLFGNFGF